MKNNSRKQRKSRPSTPFTSNSTKKQNGGISQAEQAEYKRRGYAPVTVLVTSKAGGIRTDSFLTFVRADVDLGAFGRAIQDQYAEMGPGRVMLWFAGHVGNHMPSLPPRIASSEQLLEIRERLAETQLFEAGELPPFVVNVAV